MPLCHGKYSLNSHYRVAVIGGGVVGCSVLYHLAKMGWSDIVLFERSELTAGSTWHAAGGFHPLNNDVNISTLQSYTINLYDEIQRESGQDIGMVKTGNVAIAANRERWEHLRYMQTIFRGMGLETELMTPSQIQEVCPIVDTSDLYGGMWDELVGHVDPHGTTVAYAKAAQKRGAQIILQNRVIELKPRQEGAWNVVTEKGTAVAEHVVNAAGLWAKKVGQMAGVNLPVSPMQHHYLVTEDIEELKQRSDFIAAILDLDGFTYLRQERQGILMGIYELEPKVWHLEGAPWDYGMELIPEELDRIAPQLSKGFERFPIFQRVGIKNWVNGAFTFAPDGNPLVGPVPGLKNYWVACAVMAGFSQGGGVGLSLAQWMIEGESEADVFGMDVARYGGFAANDHYLSETVSQFYARRFVLTYPNEELPAGRPVDVSPVHNELKAAGAQFGFLWGMEVPLFFTPGYREFQEIPTLRRSNAFEFVDREVKAVRSAVGMIDITGFARYEVTGRDSKEWLDRLLACRLPDVGKVRLAPMLAKSGRLAGDLTVLRLAEDQFWLMGSYYLQAWHMRWFNDHLPECDVQIKNLSTDWTGMAICGPHSRALLHELVQDDVSNEAFRFMSVCEMDVADCKAVVARLSVAGELGYEINVPKPHQPALFELLADIGRKYDLKHFGFRAMNSLRMEKGFGVWSKEFTSAYTPGMAGLDRFIDFENKEFIGKENALRMQESPSTQALALLEIDSVDADVTGFEPVWLNQILVGFVTSGGYGHWVKRSLAFAYIERDALDSAATYAVDVVGSACEAKLLMEIPYDPKGLRMRS